MTARRLAAVKALTVPQPWDLADVLTDSSSPWATAGWYHWVFEFPAPVDPLIPCRGRPGLWVPPATVAERLSGVV